MIRNLSFADYLDLEQEDSFPEAAAIKTTRTPRFTETTVHKKPGNRTVSIKELLREE
jgi:hypothetical protein